MRKLKQRKHRQAQGRFMVEGLQLIGMAAEAGHRPLEIFFCPDQLSGSTGPALLERLIAGGGRAYPVSARLMAGLSERDSPQGLIATFPLFEAALEEVLMAGPRPALFLVLDRLQDPGNLGTLIRTADAIGAGGVIMVEPGVDVFDPKTVRGSMGSLFNLPLVHIEAPKSLFTALQQHKIKAVGADGYQGHLPWGPHSQILTASIALVLGNEARGLSPDLRAHLQHWVRLPMRGQAESLNVAIAGAVLMYQWLQVNGLDQLDDRCG